MNPPENAKIYQGELADFWFDENGILYAVSKAVPRTLEKQKMNYDLIREITGNEKVCLLADNSVTYTQDNHTREYSAKEIPSLFKAMAVISRTSLGKAASFLFQYYEGQPIPIMVFDNEKDARTWLMQYVNDIP